MYQNTCTSCDHFFSYPLLSIHFTAILQTVLIVSLYNKKGVLKQLSIVYYCNLQLLQSHGKLMILMVGEDDT